MHYTVHIKKLIKRKILDAFIGEIKNSDIVKRSCKR
jgi:hypothetical protein